MLCLNGQEIGLVVVILVQCLCTVSAAYFNFEPQFTVLTKTHFELSPANVRSLRSHLARFLCSPKELAGRLVLLSSPSCALRPPTTATSCPFSLTRGRFYLKPRYSETKKELAKSSFMRDYTQGITFSAPLRPFGNQFMLGAVRVRAKILQTFSLQPVTLQAHLHQIQTHS